MNNVNKTTYIKIKSGNMFTLKLSKFHDDMFYAVLQNVAIIILLYLIVLSTADSEKCLQGYIYGWK